MTRLLVSVRSAGEAAIAVAAGVGIVDVKEPANGPLGRASDRVIRAVLDQVNGRTAVSIASGEVVEDSAPPLEGVVYAKVGLRGAGRSWRNRWRAWRALLPPGCRAVAVAYAEGRTVNAPDLEDVLELALAECADAYLIDTAVKDGRTLIDHVSVERLGRCIAACRQARVRIALAGSLSQDDVARVAPLAPDWIAVRGAACRAGRGSELDAGRVRQLVRAAENPPCLGGRRPVPFAAKP
jgi:hypothetical protein